jgi:hypothetical protein
MKYISTLLILSLFTFPTFASDHQFSLIKPIAGKHFTERNHPQGLKWNDNFLNSLGVGYRYAVTENHNFDSNIVYVEENSVGNNAWYLHVGYVYDINEQWSVGAVSGIRNGYPKKAENRSKEDFIISGYAHIEYCPVEKWCGFGMIAPNVAVANLKYKFDSF